MSAKSKHRKALIEQRISECKKHYQRAELVGGCVLLKSEYWTARAERAAQQKLNETLIQEDIRGEWFAMLSHMANQAGFKTRMGITSIQDEVRRIPAVGLAVKHRATAAE
jgi:hypothetical protein